MEEMIILVDSREKEPWKFSFYNGINEYRTTGLKTGDYTLWGYENIFCIERKRNTGEIAINFGSKWKTFQRELERMKSFPYKYLICEFPEHYLDYFPEKSGIPEKYWSKLRMNSGFLKKRLYEETSRYNIELIFSSNKEEAEQRAFQIIKQVLEDNE